MKLPRWRPWAYYAIGIGGYVVLSLLAGMAGDRMALALTALSVVWLLVFVIWAWKRTDEAAREAHKFAWFWGGSFGALAGLLLILTLALAISPQLKSASGQPRPHISTTFQFSRKGADLAPPKEPVDRTPRVLADNEQIVTRQGLAVFLVAGLMMGALLMMVMQLLGYGVTWLGWWISKR